MAEVQISQDVLTILSAMECDGDIARITGGQLDRRTYVSVNRVLETLGGVWQRAARGHRFDGDAASILDEVIISGTYDRQKTGVNAYDFFPTPDALADATIAIADIQRDHRVLEPSAGTGALARRAVAIVGEVNVWAVEIRHDLAASLRALGILLSAGADFLTIAPHPAAERVVMNPPFSKQQDIDHITHAYKFLMPGGRLVSIASAGVSFRSDAKATRFRAFVDACGGSITPNPAGSFKASGTMVNTVTVILPHTAEVSRG